MKPGELAIAGVKKTSAWLPEQRSNDLMMGGATPPREEKFQQIGKRL